MRNGRDEELTIKTLPDEAKQGTCMNKVLEAREFGKIYEYTWVHKRCEQRCHMSASLSSKPLHAFLSYCPPLVCVSCLFCAWFDAVAETTQYPCWAPITNTALVLALSSVKLCAWCSLLSVLSADQVTSPRVFQNLQLISKWWFWYILWQFQAWLPRNVYFCVLA